MIGLSAALVVKTGKDAAKTAVIKGERVVDRHHITQALNENIQHK
jgi:hypothetical protein